MRQVLLSSSGAILARMPRPPIEAGAVLVKVHFSLISAGTELAGLRGSSDPDRSGSERVTDLSNRALFYLGKAAKNPRRAAQRLASLARSTITEHLVRRPRPGRPPIQVGAIVWKRERASEFVLDQSELRLTTDDSAAHYQAISQEFLIPVDRVAELSLTGAVLKGAITVGFLNHDRSA